MKQESDSRRTVRTDAREGISRLKAGEDVKRRIGRPRDPQVAARDEAIYQLITDGTASRSALAAATGHDRDAVYLSCKRLQTQGRIRPCLGANGAAVWTIADGTPCP